MIIKDKANSVIYHVKLRLKVHVKAPDCIPVCLFGALMKQGYVYFDSFHSFSICTTYHKQASVVDSVHVHHVVSEPPNPQTLEGGSDYVTLTALVYVLYVCPPIT